jgi:deoxycytidine triphosphate deaminase
VWKTSTSGRRRIAAWSSQIGRSRASWRRAGSRSSPYDDSLLQPSSVDVRVDRYFRVFHNNRYPYIDVREEQEDLTELVEVEEDTPFVLHPGEFVLGSTLERVRLPDDLVARWKGKSSSAGSAC